MSREWWREWWTPPPALPADCPVNGCPYSVNACPGHDDEDRR